MNFVLFKYKFDLFFLVGKVLDYVFVKWIYVFICLFIYREGVRSCLFVQLSLFISVGKVLNSHSHWICP